MVEKKFKVEENRPLGGEYFLMKICAPEIAATAEPGQFVMVKVTGSDTPLLKRPLGILKTEGDYIWLYYIVKGKGTALLSECPEGSEIQLLGPLGTPFPELKGKNILAIAGGIGLVPVYFALHSMGKENTCHLIYGGRNEQDMNLLDEIEALKLDSVTLYTDDGTKGHKGRVNRDLKELIAKNSIDTTLICGPDPMMEALSKDLEGMELQNYVSLEALMGCGIGICHSCVVKMTDGNYQKVCSDGPVFRLEDVQWQI